MDETESEVAVERSPAWTIVATLTGLGVCALTGLTSAGLLLAYMGWFRPASFWPLGAVVTMALVALLRPWRLADRVPQWSGAGPPVAAVAIIIAITLVNGVNAAEHINTDRDPGVYNTTGRWLVDNESLVVEARTGPLVDARDLVVVGPGYYLTAGPNDLHAQFVHGLPVLLAAGNWIGGDQLMLRVVPAIGGLGLLAFFMLAARLVRPWIAVTATAAWGLNLVATHFSRDAFSEVPAMAMVLAGLWVLLVALDRLDWRRAAVAGVLLGAPLLVRIDGALQLGPVLVFLALLRWEAGPDRARARALDAVTAAVGLAALAPGIIGWLDVRYRSPAYYLALRSDVRLMWAAITVGVAAYLVAAAAGSRLSGLRGWWMRRRGTVGAVSGALIVVGTAYGWFIRPNIETSRGEPVAYWALIQEAEGLEIDTTRRYIEDTVRWLAWYLGPVGLAAAVAGMAWAAWRGVGGRRPDLVLLLGVLIPTAIAATANPRIYTDQIWTMRRFMVVVLPLLVVFAAVVVDVAWGDRARRRWSSVVAITVGILLVAAPAVSQVPVASESRGNGQLLVVTQTCEVLGDDGAVLVSDERGLSLHLVATLRSFCEVPSAAWPVGGQRARLDELARAWEAQGRRLFVVGDPATLARDYPDMPIVRQVGTGNERWLEGTLGSRPDEMVHQELRYGIAEVLTG